MQRKMNGHHNQNVKSGNNNKAEKDNSDKDVRKQRTQKVK
jgi:hypothetical protein